MRWCKPVDTECFQSHRDEAQHSQGYFQLSLHESLTMRQGVPRHQKCLAKCQKCRRDSLSCRNGDGKTQIPRGHPQDTSPHMCYPFTCQWEGDPSPTLDGTGERYQRKGTQTTLISHHNSGLATASEEFHTLQRLVVRHSSKVRECAFSFIYLLLLFFLLPIK